MSEEKISKNKAVVFITGNLFALGSLAFFIGSLNLESYYISFGLKYQYLGIPNHHILYRGITSVISSPYLIILYIAVMTWIGLEDISTVSKDRFASKMKRLLPYKTFIIFILIIVFLLLSVKISLLSGYSQAKIDMNVKTSTLPRVVEITFSEKNQHALNEKLSPFNDFRFLLSTRTHFIIFKPINNEGEIPKVVWIRIGDVNAFETIFLP